MVLDLSSHILIQMRYPSINLKHKGPRLPLGLSCELGLVTLVCTCNINNSTCHDFFQPFFRDRRILNMQHFVFLVAMYINGPIHI